MVVALGLNWCETGIFKGLIKNKLTGTGVSKAVCTLSCDTVSAVQPEHCRRLLLSPLLAWRNSTTLTNEAVVFLRRNVDIRSVIINPETEIRQTNMIRVFTELLQTKTLEKLRRSQRVIR